ncbi:SDR family oxidoreductase, partial [Pseudoalteromonas sp. NZS100_1]|nr:SDR family oxidoreductase [Pseudoalteromonas sp. NZS100_1]
HLPAGASVITTASVQAYEPSAILLDYATTKAGIVAYTKALATQLIEKGVRANVVAPGPFWTVLQPSGGQPQEKVKKFGEQSQFGRPGQPVEIARRPHQTAKQEQRGQQMGREAKMADVDAIFEARGDHPPADRTLQPDERGKREQAPAVTAGDRAAPGVPDQWHDQR